MARKGNQQKNVDRHSSNQRKEVSDSGPTFPNTQGRESISKMNVDGGVEHHNKSKPLRERVNNTNHEGDEKKSKRKPGKFPRNERQGVNATMSSEQPVLFGDSAGNDSKNISGTEASGSRQESVMFFDMNHGPEIPSSSSSQFNGMSTHDNVDGSDLSDPVLVRHLRSLALSIYRTSAEWLEKQTPVFISVKANVLIARDYVRTKIEHAYPIVLRRIKHFGSLVLLLAIVWLECSLRGIHSFLRMGTTSFFSVIWCSVLSLIAMIGMFKLLMALALAVFVGLFIGFTALALLIAISGFVILWLYGSFWTTSMVILCGGLAFIFSYQRVALFITTMYSVYCAWTYVGWFGLLLGLNLSFVSNDALIFLLRNTTNEQRGPSEQADGQSGSFPGDPAHASSSETVGGLPADRSPGIPSTSGSEEMTSEDEVTRLLNCTDHYMALGLSRFDNVDVSFLKREYRKKAMLVHPDKNMGNDKAAEAFKKLQNAYEILLDSFKRKEYDDELRKEELLSYFRSFQSTSQKSRGQGFFGSGVGQTGTDAEDPLGESRQIACRKCNNFHIWIHTKKLKPRARWCQDCNDFHSAKDGDGWVEQSSQPFFFGILQKVDAPRAYVCASSKIYDATEWYICQGMRCPVNTHKPSFHVNTNVTSRHNNGKGTSSGQRDGMPTSYMEGTMTEEEFFEWLQNAVQAGVFDNFAGSTSESPTAQQGKSAGGNSGGGKRKKKGKKQW